MLRHRRVLATLAVVVCALVIHAPRAVDAATIIKLNLGSVSPDVRFDGTNFFTVSDGNAATAGDQDTGVLFEDFLDSESDILTPDASFSIQGLTASGPAAVFGGSLVLQSFTGGTFSLYSPAPDNTLLLSGNLADSALTGTTGLSAGALFTTSFGEVTGGTLAPLILADSLTLSMNLTGIVSDNGAAGFSVQLIGGGVPPFFELGELRPFSADAQVNIEAAPIPEPSTCMLMAAAAVGVAGASRRARRVRC